MMSRVWLRKREGPDAGASGCRRRAKGEWKERSKRASLQQPVSVAEPPGNASQEGTKCHLGFRSEMSPSVAVVQSPAWARVGGFLGDGCDFQMNASGTRSMGVQYGRFGAEGDHVFALELSMLVRFVPPEQHGALRERLVAIVDELAAHPWCLQAFLGWGKYEYRTNLYETAAGIAPPPEGFGLRHHARWLRAVSDAGWLGPGLRRLVSGGTDAETALAAVADLEACGDSLRVTRRAEVPPQALERALAALLPSAEDLATR